MKKALGALGLGLLLSSGHAAENFVKGELLVKLRPGKLDSFLARKSFKVKQVIKTSFGEFATIDASEGLNTLRQKLLNDSTISYAEPNYIYKAIGVRNRVLSSDPKFGDLWGLKNTGKNEPASSGGNSSPTGKAGADVDALRAWQITKGDKRVKIAVIDTGVDYNHPDLKNNMWVNQAELNGSPNVDDDGNGYIDDIHGYDFANNDGDPMDGNGHGTHCSGTIAATHDNGIGVAGVMANASIVAVKFLSDAGSGTTVDAIKAVDYATKLGVDIMSNSWGGGGFSQALFDAIKNAQSKGIVFTAAAGNSSTNNNTTPHYPSNYELENVISVAAHNYNDTLATFSCYGSRTVHVAAPGRNILSTIPGNRYAVYSGTSMATPHVSGVVGLYLAQNGKTNVRELREKLMKSSVGAPSYNRKTLGGGRVNAYNLLMNLEMPRPPKPDESKWETSFAHSFSSDHPYKNGIKDAREFTFPGAKFVRAVVKKYEIEAEYDYLKVSDQNGNEVDSIDGNGENYKSEYVEGDTIKLEFSSDSSINKWGFAIDMFEVIY